MTGLKGHRNETLSSAEWPDAIVESTRRQSEPPKIITVEANGSVEKERSKFSAKVPKSGEKRVTLAIEEDDDSDLENSVAEVIQNNSAFWAVSLKVSNIFIDHPECIKVNVSMKTLYISSQVEMNSKTSSLKVWPLGITFIIE